MRVVIVGSSMRPFFKPGDVLAVEPVAVEDVRLGATVLFEASGRGLTAHRVVAVQGGIVTQGDSVSRRDGVIAPSQLVGRVVARVRSQRRVPISRFEELLGLGCAPAIRAARKVLRGGVRRLATWIDPRWIYLWLPSRKIRFARREGERDEVFMMDRNLVANPNVVLEREEDGALLFNLITGELQILNETGAFLFGLLDGQHSKGDLVERLEAEYSILDRAQAEADVEEFLGQMIAAHLAGPSEHVAASGSEP